MSPADDKDKPDVEINIEAEQPRPEEPKAEAPEVAPPLPVIPVDPLSDLEEERQGRRWLMLIVYFLMALAVAILVVVGGRWIYRSVTDKNEPAPTTTTNQPAGQNVPQAPGASQPPQSPDSQPSDSGTAPAPGQGNTQAGQLPDNGPGNIAALFVGVALVTGGLHYIYSLRRQNI